MTTRLAFWLGRLIVAAIALAAGGHAAVAYNVPGSNNAMLAPVMRMAATDTLGMVTHCGDDFQTTSRASNSLDGRTGSATAGVGWGDGYVGTDLRTNSAEFGSGLFASDYDMVVGNVCAARNFNFSAGTIQLGAAFTFESGDGTSLYNRGTMSHDGVGGALILAWKPAPLTRLYVTGGMSSLNFDVTRNGGLISGSYDATRWFAAAGITHRMDFGDWFVRTDGSLQYVDFSSDAYQEFGFGLGISAPGFVPGSSFSMLLANAEARVGYRFGDFEPYVLAGFTYDFDNGAALPASLQMLEIQEAGQTAGYFGAGFNWMMGSAGALGIEATSAYGTDDWRNLQVRGRLSFKY